jgi:rRNA pseudouridine-1189 N-methylase Emg1 (Nep1/Mra1 family)
MRNKLFNANEIHGNEFIDEFLHLFLLLFEKAPLKSQDKLDIYIASTNEN